MFKSLLLAVTLLAISSAFAQEPPASELVRLDRSLTKSLDDKANDRIDEKAYQEFLTKFRVELAEVVIRAEPTPPNTALHSRILSKLGDTKQAMAVLGRVLAQDPDNAAARVALSQVRYDQHDYPAALAEANAVLALDPANKEALALKRFSEGRVRPGASKGATEVRSSAQPGAVVAVEPDPARRQRVRETLGHITRAKEALMAGRGDEALSWANKAVQSDPAPAVLKFAAEVRKIVDGGKILAVPRTDETPAPKSGGIPLWPLLPAAALGGAAYSVAKSRKTVESEDGFNESERPQSGELQRFVAGAILAGLVAAGLYLGGAYVVSAGGAPVARFLAGSGQQAVRLAKSEAGSISPSNAQALTRGVSALPRRVPGFSAVESQVINEAQEILVSPQFAQLREAYKAGRPAVVNIGGRVIQFEPDIPSEYSAMTMFKDNGFALGRTAFRSAQELQRTVLHELHRLATSQSAGGVHGPLAKQETDAAFSFAERAVGALEK